MSIIQSNVVNLFQSLKFLPSEIDILALSSLLVLRINM